VPEHRYVVADEGIRLDVFVAQATGLSRRKARKLISDGGVFVDGKRVRVQGRPLRRGAQVKTHGQLVSTSSEVRDALQVLCMSPRWLAVNKPVGMPTSPTAQGAAGTAKEELERKLAQAAGQKVQLHPVHRLDRETSGVLLFARDAEAAAALSQPFHDGHAARRYLALVEGQVADNVLRIDAPIAKVDGRGPSRRQVHPSGQPSLTLATTLWRGRRTSLLSCAPQTGRTHQLRLHLAHIGHPLVGDTLYGAQPAQDGLFGLHALYLELDTGDGGLPFCALPPDVWVQAALDDGLAAETLAAVVQPYQRRAGR